MTLLHAIILSLVQGVSELFPVSSLGHIIIIPTLLGWKEQHILDPNGPFVPFVVTLHLGTAAALIVFYWKDWVKIVGDFFRGLSNGKPFETGKVAWLLIAGTIPAGIVGFVFEKHLRWLFSQPTVAATFLMVNGVLMLAVEHLRRKADVTVNLEEEMVASGQRKHLEKLTFGQAIGVGFMQCLAYIPGLSRSGACIAGGLISKLTHEDAARYAFQLVTPIILVAGLKEVPQLRHSGHDMAMLSAIGFVLSGITAYLSVKFLTKYFETKRLDPFGYYCMAIGVVAMFLLHHAR